ncbi:putative ferric-chelate reductase 1 [Mytilus trossulus]|uniref:putative ferric-chelate reductase 1 n=1 Tax=Mytilus trossulus TaxID=6551 RepID=UPI0030045E12
MFYLLALWIGFTNCVLSYNLSNIPGRDCVDKLLKTNQSYDIVDITNTSSFDSVECPRRSNKLKIIEVVPPNKTKFIFRDIFICWPDNIHLGTLIFNGGILKTRPNITTTSVCSPRDSIVVYKNFHRKTYVLLRMHGEVQLTGRVLSTMESRIKPAKASAIIRTGNHTRTTRQKRQSIEHPSYTEKSSITDGLECGKTRSCFRHGMKNCQHFGCDYFLSYWMDKQKAVVDFELSGKSDGWLAVGFSSDRKMGGDAIFGCIFQHTRTLPIRAASFEDPHPHVRPQEKHNFALKHSESKNGYIYCRFIVPVKRRDSGVDLTNEWVQFYARGNVSAGLMEKHHERPLMSERLISIVETVNVITVVNAGSILFPLPLLYTVGIWI